MVKFGGVRNFIVGTWSQEGLDVCADLNLPCADVAAHLPEPLENPSSGEFYSGHDYLVCGGLWGLGPAACTIWCNEKGTSATGWDVVFIVCP